MNDARNGTAPVCAGIREALVWYPTGSLSEEERRRIAAHVAVCPECAEMLQFVTGFKAEIEEGPSPHPDPETLVLYAEDPQAVPASERSLIESHVKSCPTCAQELLLLSEVERDLAAGGAAIEDTRAAAATGRKMEQPSRAPRAGEPRVGETLRALWRTVSSSVLRPVPAAVYLVAAVIAVVAAIQQRPVVSGPSGVGVSEGAAAHAGSVLILPDQRGNLRSVSPADRAIPALDLAARRFVNLEFTELASPPDPGAVYRVAFTASGDARPALEMAVPGSNFAENYTLCLVLPPRVVPPGTYTVSVSAPDGEEVFRSLLEAR